MNSYTLYICVKDSLIITTKCGIKIDCINYMHSLLLYILSSSKIIQFFISTCRKCGRAYVNVFFRSLFQHFKTNCLFSLKNMLYIGLSINRYIGIIGYLRYSVFHYRQFYIKTISENL